MTHFCYYIPCFELWPLLTENDCFSVLSNLQSCFLYLVLIWVIVCGPELATQTILTTQSAWELLKPFFIVLVNNLCMIIFIHECCVV
jgi:hypothetical protein